MYSVYTKYKKKTKTYIRKIFFAAKLKKY